MVCRGAAYAQSLKKIYYSYQSVAIKYTPPSEPFSVSHLVPVQMPWTARMDGVRVRARACTCRLQVQVQVRQQA